MRYHYAESPTLDWCRCWAVADHFGSTGQLSGWAASPRFHPLLRVLLQELAPESSVWFVLGLGWWLFRR